MRRRRRRRRRECGGAAFLPVLVPAVRSGSTLAPGGKALKGWVGCRDNPSHQLIRGGNMGTLTGVVGWG
eukprot:751231-Hanusia_phi.AAC.10